jgi:hypothetical protein
VAWRAAGNGIRAEALQQVKAMAQLWHPTDLTDAD